MYLCSAQIEDSLEQNKCNLCREKQRHFSSQEDTGYDCPYPGRANIIVAGISPKRFRKNPLADENSNFEQEIFSE